MTLFPVPAGAAAPAVLLGTSAFGRLRDAGPVYDAFWTAGGRCFDTAWIYGDSVEPGCCERVLGRWMRERAVAGEAVILAKGAHTPDCVPDRVRPQLEESLARLDVPSVAVYMLHRDNPEVSAGELVDALAGLVRGGLARAVGVSNWTLARLQEAIAYARRHGLPAPEAVSNQFSLAHMVRPIHPGSHGAHDDAWRAWLRTGEVSLVPWASQGRGVFALEGADDLRTGPLADCWYSEENGRRLARARRLSERRGVSATSIALAWVLAQPMRVHPIIGPRRVEEVRDSMAGPTCRLTAAERDWLETGGPEPRGE